MTIDARKLQQRLGVTADGVIGRSTLTALFVKLGCAPARAAELALAANVHLRTYLILDNGLRLSHFMAQLAHESGGFRYMEEIASGAAYEGRKDLGNTQPGDGTRYKGRGPIQLTGRANYRSFGQMLGIDLESNPQLAAIPSIGMLTACAYWTTRGLNDLADADNVIGITKKINGGLTGIDDRRKWLNKIKDLLA